MTIPEHIELGQVIFDEIAPYLKDMEHIDKAILLAKLTEICMFGLNASKANQIDSIKNILTRVSNSVNL